MLDITNLQAGYKRHHILFGVSFHISSGEFVTILGSNGSGKSTLAKAIVGLVEIYDGSITFRQHNITHYSTERIIHLGLGYVPQVRNVFPQLTVDENLEITSAVFQRDHTPQIYSLFPELVSHRLQKALTLSGGERQLLAIARTLTARPHLFLLDEPSTGLSLAMTQRVFSFLRSLVCQGIAVLVIEQNRNVLKYTDRLCILEHGKMKTD